MSTPELAMVSIDCADPAAAAAFWSAFLGWDLAYSEENYAMLQGPATRLGFGRVEGYEPPAWPNPAGTKQFHLDIGVDDVEAAETRCVELGAVLPEEQPGADRWRVLIDPAGHPFCLTVLANWG
ncbi:VOC family protein [Nocardioides acrostichi]|uniref:VOC family protein n=1 Tax=Nocardioides acrostichi TaxID=2784339 RepID=A0A930V439_9ACTN|nr:VOC family protein [Nocardioides acrostichi]MBF4162859.1 VOC family protein [Nocardioides acrostichi]